MREGAAHATIKSYWSALRMLARWWRGPLREASREDLLAYLTYCLKEKDYSRATMNQVVNAVRAYYERVLGWPKDELQLPRPRKNRTLPNVCSGEEALRMIRSVRNLKHRTILTLIYGLGLRKGEVQKLLVSHVDLNRGVIHIAQAKGNKDRMLSLQTTLAEQLGRYLEAYRPAHWLFEGQTGGQYSATSIQAIFVRAKEASRLPAQLTVHGLRHSYATHMVERGTPLRYSKGAPRTREYPDDADLPAHVEQAFQGPVRSAGGAVREIGIVYLGYTPEGLRSVNVRSTLACGTATGVSVAVYIWGYRL